MKITSPEEILIFWFKEWSYKEWFANKPELDALVRERFSDTHAYAARGESSDWRTTPQGRLAEVIVLDQFSRNMFRGTPEAFASDTLALELARSAVADRVDEKLSLQERRFLYMPYMHSESKQAHEEAVVLFEKLGDAGTFRYEREHKDIIDRFGRYPHRNAILGRTSTPEELEFLKTHKGF